MTHCGWVERVTLKHRDVRLEPLDVSHAAELAVAAERFDTFQYFSRGPMSLDEVGMRSFIEHLLGPAQTVAFCVIDACSGLRVGITTYLDIRVAHRGLEIGWTWYAPSVRGTRVNPASKFLLLHHAFEYLGAIRVCLKTDERNARSRAAILKLGARFEGILRHSVIMPDGFMRNTAVYSILADEWPGVREGLLERLGGH